MFENIFCVYYTKKDELDHWQLSMKSLVTHVKLPIFHLSIMNLFYSYIHIDRLYTSTIDTMVTYIHMSSSVVVLNVQ